MTQPALQKIGIPIGNGVDIISCNYNKSVLTMMHPKPATINMNCEEIGKRAADIMAFRASQGNNIPHINITIKPTLVLPKDL